MKRLLFLMGLVGALFAAMPAVATDEDGRQCQDSDNADIPLFTKGGWIPTACIQLCDTKVAADSGCTEWDFADSPGMPDMIVLEYEENPDVASPADDCDATPDYTLSTGPVTNGGITGNGVPAYDIDSSTVVMNPTTNRVVIITKDNPLDRFLFVTIADDAGCTDVDVRMFMYNRKTGLF